MASIIVDFDEAQITYLSPKKEDWAHGVFSLPNLYGGSQTWPDFVVDNESDNATFGAIKVSFRGTSIGFFGTTPERTASQYVVVSIDGGNFHNSFFNNSLFGDTSPVSTRQWYQSPTLSEGEHIIALNRIPDVSFDYLVLTAGENTPLGGKRLIVDDSDSSLVYAGSWTRNDAIYARKVNDIYLSGVHYGNATRDTSTEGSSATFQFTGSLPAVYGTLNYDNIGFVSVKYTLDGHSSILNHSSTPAIQNSYVALGNNLLFSATSGPPGDHTLTIEILECDNQTYSVDYFLYTPSFDTLAQKVSANITLTTPSSTTVSPSLSASPSNTGSSSKPKSTPVGGIVGGIIGGIIVLGCLVLFLLCRKHLIRRLSGQGSRSQEGEAITPTLEPFPNNVSFGGNAIGNVDDSGPSPLHKSPAFLVSLHSADAPMVAHNLDPGSPLSTTTAKNASEEDASNPPPYYQR